MLIELWRKVLGTDYSGTCCGICGNDFDRGSVFPVALTDDAKAEIGEVCPHCLDHLNRRKRDAEDPTLGNWPARGWPPFVTWRRRARGTPRPCSPTARRSRRRPRVGRHKKTRSPRA